MFVVDNGWVQSAARRRRGTSSEPGRRTRPTTPACARPVIVHWDGHTKAGKYPDLVSTIDLAPTVLTACGVKVPDAMPA